MHTDATAGGDEDLAVVPRIDQVRQDRVASRRSLLCLDALSFFIADVQTGFGPFIAVYLATSGWSEGEIGEALSLGAIAAMASQLPGGALVDRLRDKRIAAGAACIVVAVAAVLFAVSASKAAVMLSEVLHSFGSAMLGPALAAVSLALVGRGRLGERMGRNARFAAIGNGAAAAVLGVAGSYFSPRSVFWLTTAFMVPGLMALGLLPASELQSEPPPPGPPDKTKGLAQDVRALFTDRRVLGFSLCVALFHLANAALLPLAGAELARSLGQRTNLVIAAAVVAPQSVVALISPFVGRIADLRGPRLILVLGFAAVPLRAFFLATVTGPYPVIAVQTLDGISAATFGVVVPLVAAELTRGTDRFNLCLGTFGLATAIGATISTSVAGALADRWGNQFAFLALAACGLAAVLTAYLTAPRKTNGGAPVRPSRT